MKGGYFGQKKTDASDSGSCGWHSNFYHKYFEGFVEYEEFSANGKKHLKRIYAGDWYQLDIPDIRRKLLKFSYTLLFLLAIFLFYWAFVANIPANRKWYVVFPEALTVLFGSAFLLSLANYLLSRGKLTIYEYRSSSIALQRNCKCYEVSGLVTLTAMLLQMLLEGFQLQTFLCMGFILISVFCFFLIGRIESRQPYVEILNDTAIPESAATIR